MSDLRNRVALVTGGSRGIGKAIASALAQAGAAVAVNYRERGEEAAAVVESISKAGGRAAAFGADVSVRTAVETMVHQIEDRFGPIDVLINNAGIAQTRGLDDITEQDFDRTIAVNLKSAFLCTQAVLPGMRSRRWGRIVNISSIAARGSRGNQRCLQCLKGRSRGPDARIRIASRRRRCHGKRRGPWTDRHGNGQTADRGRSCRTNSGRARRSGDEIAQAVLLLVENSFITGQTIMVNGGSLFS